VVSFTVAVNRRRYNRTTGQWQPLDTVFHRVVAFGQLAENAAITLDKRVAVTVTGELGDDSRTGQDGQPEAALQPLPVAGRCRTAGAAPTGVHEGRSNTAVVSSRLG
jgi:single-stranded DNA-binding protein